MGNLFLKGGGLLEIFTEFRLRYFKSGDMFKSRYHGQYHVAAYILSCVCVNRAFDIEARADVEVCLSHLEKNMTSDSAVVNIDFSLESLCLAHYYTTDTEIKNMLLEFLSRYSACLNAEISAKAIDYYLLRYFNCKYFLEYLHQDVVIPVQVDDVVNKLKMTDGVLFDSYTGDKGNPDLAYHCRNFQILCLCFSILKDDSVRELLIKALRFTNLIMTTSGNISYYGRTSGMVYGDVSLVMGLRLLFAEDIPLEFSSFMKKFSESYVRPSEKDILVNTAGTSERDRMGFDSYVYPMVYKLYSLSRILYSYHDTEVKLLPFSAHPARNVFFLDVESGFLRFSGESCEVVTNVLGHQDAMIRPGDNRCMPMTPCVIESEGGAIVPVPFESIVKYPFESFFEKLIRKLKNKFISSWGDKLRQGFQPVFVIGDEILSVRKAVIKTASENNALIQVEECYKQIKIAKESKPEKVRHDASIFIDVSEEMKISWFFDGCSEVLYHVIIGIDDQFYVDGNFLIINGARVIRLSGEIRRVRKNLYKKKSALGYLVVSELLIDLVGKEFEVTYL